MGIPRYLISASLKLLSVFISFAEVKLTSEENQLPDTVYPSESDFLNNFCEHCSIQIALYSRV